MLNELNNSLTKIEQGFNLAGTIPLVGCLSGYVRVHLGRWQAIAGAAVGIIGGLGVLLDENSRRSDIVMRAGVENVFHGGLNMMRGCGEVVSAALVFPSLIALPSVAENPNPIMFPYGFMQVAPQRQQN